MTDSRRFGRAGLLAVSVGAALASSVGMASADSSTDWASSIDSLLSGSALPAQSSGTDLAISFDGYSLLQEGNATANTAAGEYGLAIAQGSGAYAYAGGGVGDVAEAEGTNALAVAGGQAGDTGANYDTAIDIGNNELPANGVADGAHAGNGDLGGGSGTGTHDIAVDIGNNSNGASGGGSEGASAGAGGLGGLPGDGNNDIAIDVGNNSGLYDGVNAIGGNNNFASETGTMSGYDEGAFAGYGGDNNIAVGDANYTVDYGGVYAQIGNDNYASVVGPANSFATAFEGNSNIAIVMDPFGTAASYADSGYGFNSDIAANLFSDGTTAVVNADNVYDILSVLGHSAGVF